MTEKAGHARPNQIDEVRHQDSELHRVSVEQVDLQRGPGETDEDEPQDHRRVAVTQRVQDVVLHRTPLEKAGGPNENKTEDGVDDEDVYPHLRVNGPGTDTNDS